jgi:hypothetical protein
MQTQGEDVMATVNEIKEFALMIDGACDSHIFFSDRMDTTGSLSDAIQYRIHAAKLEVLVDAFKTVVVEFFPDDTLERMAQHIIDQEKSGNKL